MTAPIAGANIIAGARRLITGEALRSRNPARPDQVVWSGSPRAADVPLAVEAARMAAGAWAEWPRERRFAVLRRFQSICGRRLPEIASVICDEVGKAMWDSKAEAGLLGPKIDITLDDSPDGALRRVADLKVSVAPTRAGRAWFRPHGVMAVIGPFNFPMHLPNGHIAPALAMGNTVVFKPSDKAPACGQLLAELYSEALDAENAPAGVFNLVHGGADVASALVAHDGVDGVLFTGSWGVGRRILEANLDRPSRMVALEMGGNNAAVVLDDADIRQAAIECVRSAFVTTGQRCTCTRRIVVQRGAAEKFIPAICKAASTLIVGDPRALHPVFMGPLINEAARSAVLEFQGKLARAGGVALVAARSIDGPGGGWYVSPGVMMAPRFVASGDERDVHDCGCDVEIFGPFVRVCVVDDLDGAIEQANATRYGLAASIFTRSEGAAARFLREARAGCINVNTGTAGASSKLPFGGLGLSGNHRPAGSFSLDYCAYPVAGLMEHGNAATVPEGMTFDEAWVS